MFRLAMCLASATAVAGVSVKGKNFLDTDADNLAKPVTFHQKLLVCNAYPSEEGITLSKNNIQLKSHDKLAYNTCKYVDGKIYNKDHIGFTLANSGIEGTFEVDELPSSDSVLLLIAQKRDEASTDLMAFRSFAFPAANPNSNDAQVAFINAVPNTDDTERVRLSDSTKRFTKESVREEDVKFDRVYVVESGRYDVDIVGGQFYNSEKEAAKKKEEAAAAEAKKHALEAEKKHEKKAENKHEKKAEKKVTKEEKKPVEKKPVVAVEKKPVVEKKEEKKPVEKKAQAKTSFLQSITSHFFTSKKISMTLEKGQDYVVLQTGTADHPNLIAFPGPQPTFAAKVTGFFHRMFNWI